MGNAQVKKNKLCIKTQLRFGLQAPAVYLVAFCDRGTKPLMVGSWKSSNIAQLSWHIGGGVK